MKANNIFLDWNTIHNMVRQLHSCINNNQPNGFDNIIALTRGGLIPGTILSNMFDIPLIPISYSAKNGKGTSTWYKNVLNPIDEDSTYKSLIVEDLVDSGHTLKNVVDYYKGIGYHTTTAVLHYKSCSIIEPDYYVENVLSSNWVCYPWEI